MRKKRFWSRFTRVPGEDTPPTRNIQRANKIVDTIRKWFKENVD